LATILRRVSYAMSDNKARYILTGVYFEFKDGEFCVVATNARQLSKAKAKAKAKAKDGNFILPAKTVMVLQKFLGGDKEVTLTFSDRAVSFECAAGTIQSKILEGSYPNYRQVIPKETKHRVKIERELMAECVQRGGLAIGDEKDISVRFAFTKHVLTISSQSPERGDASADMAIVYDGPEINIALDKTFVLPMLANLTENEIEIGLKDELSPFVTTVPDFISVIMPLRLN
jgi:DNA polymerase-3 subunit beta